MCVFQALDADMDLQVQHCEDLNVRGHDLLRLIGEDEKEVQRINQQLKEFQERWDNLVQQMDEQRREVSCLLFVKLNIKIFNCNQSGDVYGLFYIII